jgi:hypothetical protein
MAANRKRKLSDIAADLDNVTDIGEIRRRLLAEDGAATDDLQGPLKIRKHLIQFEKANQHNQQMRIKYADEPNKFMDSEVWVFIIAFNSPEFRPRSS